MINFESLDSYRENNRLEVKKATGGLPKSIWETYSAFANTNGGLILLGVIENKDKSLKVVGLDDPEKLVTDFWNCINDKHKVSINLLNDKKINIVDVDGDQIIVIEVPRAERTDKPVYINHNPETGTYRRNNEGDYHCTREEVSAMYRDNSFKTQDMKVLENMGFNVFSYETIRGYRNVMRIINPDHVWIDLEDNDFLYRIGAVAYSDEGNLHPTAGGLLMFGYEYEIVKEYPHYFLDYQEQFDASGRWDDRFVSSSGEWSGNIYDFYRLTYNKIQHHIKVPFQVVNGFRVEDTPVHKAVREALANCLINADYYGRRGLVIKYKPFEITMENPGRFRIDVEIAKEGIITDPRNSLLMKFFNLIDVGERSGRGIYEILKVWSEMNWDTPIIYELPDFDRTKLTLPIKYEMVNGTDVSVNVPVNSTNVPVNVPVNRRESLLEIIHKKPSITADELADIFSVTVKTIRRDLNALKDAGQIRRIGSDKSGHWKVID